MNSFAISILILFTYSIHAIRWLGLNHADHVWTEAKHCPKNKPERKKYGLVGYQSKLCRRLTDIMPVIMRAAKLTEISCQSQFADRRWNCSSVRFAPKLKPDLLKGTREQAYVYALSSAAITHQVAKACVSGHLPYCPCGINPPSSSSDGSFKWKGCSDNLIYGERLSREWADASWRLKKRQKLLQKNRTRIILPSGSNTDSSAIYNNMGRRSHRFYGDRAEVMSLEDFMRNSGKMTPRSKMNQHNNNVGRMITKQMLYKKCKCHGVSSSCSVRTCWKQLPDINTIAKRLKERYMLATEVRPMIHRINRAQPSFESVTLTDRISSESLVYIRKSPDYCSFDRSVGSLGTNGRECNATKLSLGSCDTMCCGRGYRTVELEIEEQCHCKYVHCCYVKCKQCHYFVSKHYCN